MSLPRLKKFYASAAVAESGSDFLIRLDGKPAKTRRGGMLAAPTRALADAMAAEWNAQGAEIDFISMPITRLAMTAADLGPADREAWRDSTIAFLKSDLVCYRAEAPAALAMRQAEAWDPLIAWFREWSGAELKTASGIGFVEQEAALLEAARVRLSSFDGPRLLATKVATDIAGSAVIGIAAAISAFAPDMLFDASRIDEAFQEERWGVDHEAEQRTKSLKSDFIAAARFASLL